MKFIDNIKEKSKSKKFIVDCLFVFFSIFFCYWLYQEIKGIQIYSDINQGLNHYIELNAGEELTLSPNIKTDKLWQLHFPISSDDELNDKDFICDSKILHIEQIHNKEDGISYAVIKFPEPNNEKLFKVKFSKDVKIYCNESNIVLTKQYGLPSKLCNLFILGFLAIMIFVYVVTNILNNKIKSLAVKYLIFNILLGTAFIIVNPAFNIPDERVHFNTAYNISNILMGKGSYEENNGLLIRECDNRIYPAEISDNPLFTRQLFEFWDTKDYKKFYTYSFPNILSKKFSTDEVLIHSDITDYKKRFIYYIPHTIGICLSRLLNFNQYELYYFSCFLALIFNTIILFIAFYKTKCKNILFYFFSLGAYVFQQMGHFTYDGTIYALSIGFIVLFFSYYEKRKISDLVLSIIYLSLLWNAKGHLYMPLCLLYFSLLDFGKVRKLITKKRLLTISIISFAVLLGFYLYYTIKHPENFAVHTGQHQEAVYCGTLAGFIRNPISTLFNIIVSINFDFLNLFTVLLNFTFGLYEFYISIFLIIVNLFLIYYILKDETTILYNYKMKIIVFIIIILVLFGSYYGMYVGWEISDFRIFGVQGRYLIPVGIPIYMIFNSEKFRKSETKDNSKLLFYSTVYISFFTVINFLICIMN